MKNSKIVEVRVNHFSDQTYSVSFLRREEQILYEETYLPGMCSVVRLDKFLDSFPVSEFYFNTDTMELVFDFE